MRHQNDADAGLREFAHRFPQSVLRENIQAVARFVEHQRLRIVDQRPGDQDAFGFARRHFRDGPVGEVRHSEPLQHRVGAFALRRARRSDDQKCACC